MLEHFQRDLTQEQRVALTIWKWCYRLKVEGFTLEQSRRLCFCRWLFEKGHLSG